VVADDTVDLVSEISAAYLSHESAGDKALVDRAYEQLQSETDDLFYLLAGSDVADALRVVITRCQEPYGSDAELITAVRASGVLEITTAASESRIHPVLGCEYGGPFDRFRAVHDAIGHAGAGFGFDLGGEIAAWHVQDRLHGTLAGWALATELLAVNSARSTLDAAPEHTAMLLEPGLLERSRAELPGRVVAHALDVVPAQPSLSGQQLQMSAGLGDGEHPIERVEVVERAFPAGPRQLTGNLVAGRRTRSTGGLGQLETAAVVVDQLVHTVVDRLGNRAVCG
jgi:hypothetical protein